MARIVTLFRENSYGSYVLILMLLSYLLNQADRYALGILKGQLQKPAPAGIGLTDSQYQSAVGPVFTLVYTFCGIPIGLVADRYNRKLLLAGFLLLWSAATAYGGFATSYWQMALSRFGLGIAEAGCTPFAASLISDYFAPEMRGLALGIYNMGIYTGYSIALGIGTVIEGAFGWHYVFWGFAAPGAVVALLIATTVKEPVRGGMDNLSSSSRHLPSSFDGGKEHMQIDSGLEDQQSAPPPEPVMVRLAGLFEGFTIFLCSPALLLLCLAGGIRNAAGYVWAYNNKSYYLSKGITSDQFAEFMGWIPLVAGSMGAIFGGFISDRVVARRGMAARVWVLVLSNLCAAPFCLGAILAPYPWCFLCLIPSNIIGEMWVGVTLAIVCDALPARLRTSGVAVYLFLITNIGGNMNIALPSLKSAFGEVYALIILFPALYVISVPLFLITFYAVRNRIKRQQEAEAESIYTALPGERDYKA